MAEFSEGSGQLSDILIPAFFSSIRYSKIIDSKDKWQLSIRRFGKEIKTGLYNDKERSRCEKKVSKFGYCGGNNASLRRGAG
jgi:hypothetical protein